MNRVRFEKGGLTCLMLALLWTAVGCDRGDKRPDETPVEVSSAPMEQEQPQKTRFPRNDWPCSQASADRSADWLGKWKESSGSWLNLASPALVERDGLPTPDLARSLLIEMSSSGLALNREPIASAEDLARQVESELELEAKMLELTGEDAPEDYGVIVAIEPDVPLTGVAEILTLLDQTAATRVSFVFKAPEATLTYESTPTDVNERITQLILAAEGNRDRADYLQGVLHSEFLQAMEVCPSFDEFGNALEGKSPEQQFPFIRDNLGRTWLACECKVDLELLIGLMTEEINLRYTSTTIASALDALANREGVWKDAPFERLESPSTKGQTNP